METSCHMGSLVDDTGGFGVRNWDSGGVDALRDTKHLETFLEHVVRFLIAHRCYTLRGLLDWARGKKDDLRQVACPRRRSWTQQVGTWAVMPPDMAMRGDPTVDKASSDRPTCTNRGQWRIAYTSELKRSSRIRHL